MRLQVPTLATVLFAMAPLPHVSAQHSAFNSDGALLLPRVAPLAVEQPRAFPPAGQLEARPLAPPVPAAPAATENETSRRRSIQPPVNFRLASAQEPVPPSQDKRPLRLSPRSEGARQPLSKPLAPGATAAVSTVAGSLAIVIGVFLVIVWCTRRLNSGAAGRLPKEAVEVLGRVPLVGKQHLELVRVGSKLVLLAISTSGAEAVAEVSDAADVEHLLAICRGQQSGSSSAAFRDALNQLDREPAQRGFVAAARPSARGTR